MSFSAESRALLAPYVTSLDSPVFALKNLPEEVVAVLFAYYSRSREDLRSNLLKLVQDRDLDLAGAPLEPAAEDELSLARQKAKEFHEKWVVGYGHASVAEHAVAHVAVEDVSIVASKVIEDARLASYTEKSTRYVRFPRSYYAAPELEGEAGVVYRETVEGLFDLYDALVEPVTDRIAETADRSQFKTERGFRNSCQAQACDALRYLLPAATHTNIGLTANARTLEHLISKMLSHPLREVQETGERIRVEATKVIPTLIKYARRKGYFEETPGAMRALADRFLDVARGNGGMGEWENGGVGGGAGAGVSGCGGAGEGVGVGSRSGSGTEAVRLVLSPEEAEARLAAAILYEFTDQPYPQVWERVRSLAPEAQRGIITEYLARRQRYGTEEHGYTDPPLRGLEHLYFTFDILVDYGAFRDIQRHRMATQTTQRLGCAHGYDVPELLAECGFGPRFEAAMERAAAAWERLTAAHPEEAQYVVPLAFRKRVLFTWNLRELHHFISLRSARQGHVSYRRIAQQTYQELEAAHPFLASFIRVDRQEYGMARPG